MKQQKWFLRVVILLIVAGLCIAGGRRETEAAKIRPLHMGFGAGAATGTWYLAGGYIGKFLQDSCPLVSSVTVQVTAGSVENSRLLQAEELDLIMIAGKLAYNASRGTAMYKEKMDKVRVMMRGHASLGHFIVLKESDIKTIEDLRGKRVSTGAAGSGIVAIGRSILEMHGITPDDIDERFLTYKEATDALKDGKIDCAFVLAYYPSGIVQSLASVRDIRLLPIEDSKMEEIMKANPYLAFGTIPANTYKGVDSPVLAIDTGTLYAVGSWLPDEVVYQMVKAIYENLDELGKQHPVLSTINFDWDPNVVDKIAPLHDGAKKFYQELGKME